MSSTVTTTTVVTILAWAQPIALGLIAMLTLLALLATKELAIGGDRRVMILRKALNVGIVPLLMAMAVTVGVRVAQALS
ncbi:MAG TPA: hypothetical protein VI877_04150 [Dehalococcoidia bacterium]|nr:hypothetical protein [Dehalococcoidia bacterium]HLE02665.1 hypothetical protein [Dehalococcoidia bacterium]